MTVIHVSLNTGANMVGGTFEMIPWNGIAQFQYQKAIKVKILEQTCVQGPDPCFVHCCLPIREMLKQGILLVLRDWSSLTQDSTDCGGCCMWPF